MSSLRKIIMSILFLMSFMAINLYSLTSVPVTTNMTLGHDYWNCEFVVDTDEDEIVLNLNSHTIATYGAARGTGYAIRVISQTNVEIINGFIDGYEIGIYMVGGSNNSIDKITMWNVNYGIFVDASTNLHVDESVISCGIMGVLLSEAHDAFLEWVTCNDGSYGLYVQASLRVELELCYFDENTNGFGMYLNEAPYMEVRGCSFGDNISGIKMEETYLATFEDYVEGNTVVRNHMDGNSNMGVYIRPTSIYNTFNHCDMIPNGQYNLVDQGSNNVFTNCDY